MLGACRLRLVAPAAHGSAMAPPLTPDQLFTRLDALGIAHRTYTHPPVFTVEEAKALRGSLPGGHCKSLFLKDKKGGLWLVVALEECRVDLKALADRIGAPRFSFGAPELLYEVLGIRPGSVTPFAAANDTGGRVSVVLQRAMLRPAQLPSARKRPHDSDCARRSGALSRRLRPSAGDRRYPGARGLSCACHRPRVWPCCEKRGARRRRRT